VLTYEVVDAKVLRDGTDCRLTGVRARIEEVITQFGLTVFETTTLSSLPESVRYRMRQEPCEDVLEVVYWPLEHRLWVCACAKAQASVGAIVLPLAQAIAQVFGGRAEVTVHHAATESAQEAVAVQ